MITRVVAIPNILKGFLSAGFFDDNYKRYMTSIKYLLPVDATHPKKNTTSVSRAPPTYSSCTVHMTISPTTTLKMLDLYEMLT